MAWKKFDFPVLFSPVIAARESKSEHPTRSNDRKFLITIRGFACLFFFLRSLRRGICRGTHAENFVSAPYTIANMKSL